ncbi:MAG: hypothetical protein R3B93_08680 [Bacteroidia bacterium]
MGYQHKPTFIEKIAEKLHLIPSKSASRQLPIFPDPKSLKTDQLSPTRTMGCDWVEHEAKSWPRREKHYTIVPMTCFNCESARGLLVYVDKESGAIRKFEGNPYHLGSRGRNC